MASQKINKKGAVTLTTIFVLAILGFAIMNMAYNFMSSGIGVYDDINLTSQKNDSFNRLISQQEELDDNINDIKDAAGNISIQTGVTQFLWNSFRGLGSILLLPYTIVNVAVESTTTMLGITEFVPPWIQTLMVLAIIVLIVFVILSAVTGGNPKI